MVDVDVGIAFYTITLYIQVVYIILHLLFLCSLYNILRSCSLKKEQFFTTVISRPVIFTSHPRLSL